ncbi:MAG: hypothetical protein WBG86_17620 [Polyangiales bacterium]
MRSWIPIVPCLFVVLAGCGSTQESDDDDDMQETGIEGSACQAAGIGMAECVGDADCERGLESWVMSMEMPRRSFERTVSEASCIKLTLIAGGSTSGPGPACKCRFEGGGSLSVGPVGTECLAVNRIGDCAWDGTEFPGCEIGSESNCPSFCAELMEVHRQVDMEVFDAEGVGAVCETFNCRWLGRVSDRCFMNGRDIGPAPCDPDLLLEPDPPVDPILSNPGCPFSDDPCDQSGFCGSGVVFRDTQREYHPRADGEWQGMRVRIDQQAICQGESSCGLALACIDGLCSPCVADSECASGEACALDHCVREANLGCRSYTDCKEGSLCVLSGYSSGLRGNIDMRAYCLSPSGGTPQRPEDLNR